MGLVKARATGHRKLHIHNTLENFASFTKEVIEEKIKNNQRDGAGYNIILNAHPIGRTLLLRVPKEKDDKEETAEQPMNDKIEL